MRPDRALQRIAVRRGPAGCIARRTGDCAPQRIAVDRSGGRRGCPALPPPACAPLPACTGKPTCDCLTGLCPTPGPLNSSTIDADGDFVLDCLSE